MNKDANELKKELQFLITHWHRIRDELYTRGWSYEEITAFQLSVTKAVKTFVDADNRIKQE